MIPERGDILFGRIEPVRFRKSRLKAWMLRRRPPLTLTAAKR